MSSEFKKNLHFNPWAPFRQFLALFAWTNPITLKLYQNKEDIILNKNHEKIANIFGHFAKMVIQNLENCQISKLTKISKVTQRHDFFFLTLFSSYEPNMASKLTKILQFQPWASICLFLSLKILIVLEFWIFSILDLAGPSIKPCLAENFRFSVFQPIPTIKTHSKVLRQSALE